MESMNQLHSLKMKGKRHETPGESEFTTNLDVQNEKFRFETY